LDGVIDLRRSISLLWAVALEVGDVRSDPFEQRSKCFELDEPNRMHLDCSQYEWFFPAIFGAMSHFEQADLGLTKVNQISSPVFRRWLLRKQPKLVVCKLF
jgi:hypothetical protein